MKGWLAVLILGAILGVLLACGLTSGYIDRQALLGQALAERDSAQADVAAEQVANDAMGQELVLKDEQIESVIAERDQANADSDDISAQITSLNTQISDLSSHVSSLMLQLNAANQNLENKSAETDQLIEQNRTLQAQLDQIRLDYDAGTALIQNLEAQNQAQAQRITELEALNWQAQNQPQIPVTGSEVKFFPVFIDNLDSEQVYKILIVYVSIWIVLGIGCGIYLVIRRSRAI